MSVELNHTIVWCRDKNASARYLTAILGLGDARPWGPFMVVEMGNGVSLDYHDFYNPDGEILPQHYAFLVAESEFDEIFGRIEAGGQDYWADPGLSGKGQVNRNDGAGQPQRRWPRGVFPGPRRASPRDHHSPLRVGRRAFVNGSGHCRTCQRLPVLS